MEIMYKNLIYLFRETVMDCWRLHHDVASLVAIPNESHMAHMFSFITYRCICSTEEMGWIIKFF